MFPQVRHMRSRTHRSPSRRHSSHPVDRGLTARTQLRCSQVIIARRSRAQVYQNNSVATRTRGPTKRRGAIDPAERSFSTVQFQFSSGRSILAGGVS